MMNRPTWLPRLMNVTLLIAAATLLPAATASGQATSNGFSFGIGGGFASGSGSSAGPRTSAPDAGGFGYYVLSALELPEPVRFLRPRVDLFFADWGQRVTGLTANVLVSPVRGKRLAPYALAGAGAYKMYASSPKSGWTLGVGLRIPGELRSITVESRVHAYLRGRGSEFESDRWRYLWAPIGLGVQF
jgi:hypothetical protein